MLEINKIICCDALDGLKQLDNNSEYVGIAKARLSKVQIAMFD